ncbi:acetyltransferase [Mumia zhuanghuii]|uniref:Lysine N-acyltransferase MbtK n=2 Tax=Mumia TaxID=1546255 RepID=A0ABW1QLV0_9ACTN|nr:MULTISPECIES: GNAT family N-acetyltransferase [Mumia]KAA1419777.1 acetyltransferase [Mumia zhuanghuii]
MNARHHTAVSGIGQISLEPVEPARDAAVVHRWLRDPHAEFWRMGGLDVGAVEEYLSGIAADPHQDSWLGRIDGRPTFLAETYDPAHVLLVGVHKPEPGDLGMHLLVSPPGDRPRSGLTGAVMAAVMRWCFDALGAARVVVEPDVRNAAIGRKNADAGFRVVRDVVLGDKVARLSTCTRDEFARSILGGPR